MVITEPQILECYESYKSGKACPYPEGMNRRTAEMTMSWLDSIWHDRRWTFSFNAMQCGAVLAKIKVDFGADRARDVALAIERDLDHRTKTFGSPQKVHRQAIKPYLQL